MRPSSARRVLVLRTLSTRDSRRASLSRKTCSTGKPAIGKGGGLMGLPEYNKLAEQPTQFCEGSLTRLEKCWEGRLGVSIKARRKATSSAVMTTVPLWSQVTRILSNVPCLLSGEPQQRRQSCEKRAAGGRHTRCYSWQAHPASIDHMRLTKSNCLLNP